MTQHQVASWNARLSRAPRLALDYLRGALGLAEIKRRAPERIGVLMLIDLVQDADVLLPVIRAAQADERLELALIVTDWLDTAAPGTVARLAKTGSRIVRHGRRSLAATAPNLRGWNALLTASESTAIPHRFAHALTQRANSAGLTTFTMQHGLENVGLTYREDGDVAFASNWIFTWIAPTQLPPWVGEDVRVRAIGVGRPAPAPSEQEATGDLIAVFENLHWTRYDDAYRQSLLSDLAACAAAFPDLSFVVRPHPAGRWLALQTERPPHWPANITIADPDAPAWRGASAADLLSRAKAVITTPSTVALDAAQLDRPVAVAGYGLDLGAYAPLPILRSAEDWRRFVTAALDGAGLEPSVQFKRAQTLRERPAEAILDEIAARIGP